jgi:hypothetical protein
MRAVTTICGVCVVFTSSFAREDMLMRGGEEMMRGGRIL